MLLFMVGGGKGHKNEKVIKTVEGKEREWGEYEGGTLQEHPKETFPPHNLHE